MGKRKFKTEVQQLLDLVIHSLYTKKEIFLRELISNASDAIDRCRFEALKDAAVLEDDPEFRVKLTADKEARTLTISDNGIGMNLDEVTENIGTIANSGTRAFMDSLGEGALADNAELIGQFGVGFYSAFMVADKVTLLTRRAGQPADGVYWESAGDGAYVVDQADKATRGTDVILHLREGMDEYLEEWRLRKIVKQYSDYVAYPIVMDVTRTEKPEDEEDGEEKVVVKEETLNSMKAIWRQNKDNISADEYHEFYRHVSHDWTEPLETIHFVAEGITEFRALLFIPKQAPFDMHFHEATHGPHLYVRNVFITDDCKELLPEYLRFVRGVVDSSDLPLNVSRETLQDEAILRRINKSLTGKILSALATMQADRPDDYKVFWGEFGALMKGGIHMDFANREKLEALGMYESSATEPGECITLKTYVERMPEAQKDIYYLLADNRQAAANSPHLEAFKQAGREVLFFTDPIDEFVTQSLTEFDEKKLVPVDRGEIDLGDADARKEAREQAETAHEDLVEYIEEKLADHVKEVRFSTRLTDSACCLVADEHGMGAHMERLMRAMNRDFQPGKRILELNPEHPVVGIMQQIFDADKESPKLADYVDLLYNQALLTEGSAPADPLRFAKLVSDLMVKAKD